MSEFPKRLIESDGPARRLLESARTDEPPRKVVAAAILAAQHPTFANPRASFPKKLALVSGSILVGAAMLFGGMRAFAPSSVPNMQKAAPAVATAPHEVPAASPPEENAAPSIPSTPVADLPNAPRPSSRAVAVPAPSPAQPGETKDLLREANRLRAQGLWSEAAATYQRVIDLEPDSADSYPADVALGNLELQQGRAAAALARYDHALAAHPNGALAEESRWGRARALRALGRTTEERGALEDFAKRHPESPLAAAATARVAEIAGGAR